MIDGDGGLHQYRRNGPSWPTLSFFPSSTSPKQSETTSRSILDGCKVLLVWIKALHFFSDCIPYVLGDHGALLRPN